MGSVVQLEQNPKFKILYIYVVADVIETFNAVCLAITGDVGNVVGKSEREAV